MTVLSATPSSRHPAFTLFALLAIAAGGACSSTPQPSVVIPPQAPVQASAPPSSKPPSQVETPPEPVKLPGWLLERASRHAAMAFIGADDRTIDVLFGQFEHPEEAIVRFDRKSGCAIEVIGPWPTLTKVVRASSGFSYNERLPPEDMRKLAQSEAFRSELASIVKVYAKHKRTGEDKLAFSLDGKKVLIEATDEKVLASNDGGEHFAYLDGKLVGMPHVAPDGSFGLVRVCTSGACIEPLKVAAHKLGVVSFDALPKVKTIASPSLHDAFVEPGGTFTIATRSDRFGKRTASNICLDAFEGVPSDKPKTSTCIATNWVGEWHMLSASPNARMGVVAVVGPTRKHPSEGPIRLSVRSLPDGAEREAFDVAGRWEQFQWLNVVVSDRGVVAYARDREMVIRGGGVTQRDLGLGKPLAFLGNDLVVLDTSVVDEPRGCGLIKTVTP